MTNDIDRSSAMVARRTLLVLFVLTTAGYLVGVFAMYKGTVTGAECGLILTGLAFNSAVSAVQFTRHRVPFQTYATVSTLFYSLNLCAGCVIAVACPGQHLDLFVYLFWFFPLLIVNKLVNEPGVARPIAWALRIAPVLLLGCLLRIEISIFNLEILILLSVFVLAYISYGAMLDLVTRYREAYIVERELAESFKAESEILESISDCFISLNSKFRIGYLNDAACKEFAVRRASAMNQPIARVAMGFLSASTLSQLHIASGKTAATTFEAQNEANEWYELRCFPRRGGMAIYFRNITESIAAGLKIRHAAFHDALTDLPNRLLLRERLDTALAADQGESHSTGALLFIDIDDFKTLNDTMGHYKGDLLLQQVALRLTNCARPGHSVARVGGDEFAVMVEGLSENVLIAAAEAVAIGGEFLATFDRPYLLDGYEYACKSSIGIALFHAQVDTAEDLTKRADLAMYAAKAQGRNLVRMFDPAMETFVTSRAELQSDLRRALQNNEFEVHFQPQVDAGRVVRGAEALVRWRHPRRGMILPGEFIPLAEECGLIVELGRWVLDTACAQLAEWGKDAEMRDLTLAVNVSARQILRTDFVEMVWEALRDSRADPRKLKLEITESSAMQKIEDTVAKMKALRELGVGFSLDDFGTGYSSLSHLKQLPLEELKIDRSFVTDVLTDVKGASIARTLVALGLDLNLLVIAEGVETEGQCKLLERLGCTLYQGFLFGPALTRTEFEGFVVASSQRAAGERIAS